MEGSPHNDLRKQLEDREAEVVNLRDRLEQTQSELEQSRSENDRLRQENEQLRQELKAAGTDPKAGDSSQLRGRDGDRSRPELRGRPVIGGEAAEMLGPPQSQYQPCAGDQERTGPQLWTETEELA